MSSFSVDISRPSTTKPQSLSCVSRPHTSVSNRITCSRGTVGYYDITELNNQLKYFGISEDTKNAISRKQKVVRPPASRWSTTVLSTPCDIRYTNQSSRSKSREHANSQSRHSVDTRSCYVDFAGSFNGVVRAQSLPLVARHNSPPVIRQSFDQTQLKSSKLRRGKRPKPTQKPASTSEPVQIKDGLLVIANGEVVNIKDIKRTERREEDERKGLRKEMRQHLNLVRSFDELFEELDATKVRIEKLKAA